MEIIKVKEIKEVLRGIPPNITVLFLGNPGIGKSEQVREFAMEEAKELGKEFVDYDDSKYYEIMEDPERYYVYVDLRLTELEPSDLSGIPTLTDDKVVSYSQLMFAKVLQKTAGLLFLDELTNVQRPDLQAVAYKLVLDRRIGFTKINDRVRIVAAGNTDDISSIAVPLPAPLLNRMAIFKVAVPTVEEWAEYMYKKYGTRWNTDVLAFLSMSQFSNKIYESPKEASGFEPFPSPRSWTMLSLSNVKYAKAFVGDEVGQQFLNFIKYKDKLPRVEDVIKDPKSLKNYNIEVQYLTATALINMYIEGKFTYDDSVKFLSEIAEDLPYIFSFMIHKLIALDKSFTDKVLTTNREYEKKIYEKLLAMEKYLG